MALARVVIAATGKFPNVGRAFFEAGPLFGATRLAAELAALERAGALKVPDPERAAWHFLDLCQSYVFKRLLFGVVDRVQPEEIEAAVNAGVEVFLKAYGALAAARAGSDIAVLRDFCGDFMRDRRVIEQSGQRDPAEQIAQQGRQKEPHEIVADARGAGRRPRTPPRLIRRRCARSGRAK